MICTPIGNPLGRGRLDRGRRQSVQRCDPGPHGLVEVRHLGTIHVEFSGELWRVVVRKGDGASAGTARHRPCGTRLPAGPRAAVSAACMNPVEWLIVRPRRPAAARLPSPSDRARAVAATCSPTAGASALDRSDRAPELGGHLRPAVSTQPPRWFCGVRTATGHHASRAL